MNEIRDDLLLRRYAEPLREEPDEARLVQGVLERVRSLGTVTGWLAVWLRPAFFAFVAMVIAVGVGLYRQDSNPLSDLVVSADEVLEEDAGVLR